MTGVQTCALPILAFRDALLEVEEIEQLALIDRLPTHYGSPPPLKASTERNHDSPIRTSDFFNTIGQKRKSRPGGAMYCFAPDCSLIPALGVKLSKIVLAGPTVLSAVGADPPHDGVR